MGIRTELENSRSNIKIEKELEKRNKEFTKTIGELMWLINNQITGDLPEYLFQETDGLDHAIQKLRDVIGEYHKLSGLVYRLTRNNFDLKD